MADARLDPPVGIQTLYQLRDRGILNEEAFLAARRIVRPPAAWYLWVQNFLLLIGSALVLSGVLFFFAYNWSGMGKFSQFGVIQLGIVGCVIIASIRKREQVSSKVALLSASVLVGVLLAVYGQVYQTGADAFGLFLGWAALMFGWVLIAQFAGLWMLWLAIVNIGLALYRQQVAMPALDWRYESLCVVLAFLNATALGLRELRLVRGVFWLNGHWLR